MKIHEHTKRAGLEKFQRRFESIETGKHSRKGDVVEINTQPEPCNQK
jgi:hypothetical protein